MKYDSTSSLLASGGADGGVRVWYPMAGSTRSLRGSLGVCRCLTFHPSSGEVWGGGDETIIRGWNIESTEVVGVLKGHFSSVTGLQFLSDGSKLIRSVLKIMAFIFKMQSTLPLYCQIR